MPLRKQFAFVLICLGVCGCGASGDEHLVRIKGKVTIDQQPIESGTLQFLPQGEGIAAGAAINNGEYEAAITPGKARVIITATRPTGKAIQEYSTSIPEVVSIVPAKYAQGIDIEIAPGATSQDFMLTSQ